MSYGDRLGSLLRPPHGPAALGQYDGKIPLVDLRLTYGAAEDGYTSAEKKAKAAMAGGSGELVGHAAGMPSATNLVLWLGLLGGVYWLAQHYGGRL